MIGENKVHNSKIVFSQDLVNALPMVNNDVVFIVEHGK
ncbi:hypothetical protein MITS9508_00584 [Synechococcus sp. MIT S9508]|nr:hypothetical protein MITS9508_00584 [Synechococcus sp. MIT S9508]